MTFVPLSFVVGTQACHNWPVTAETVTGHIVYINEEKHWYRVEYDLPGCKGYECFKF